MLFEEAPSIVLTSPISYCTAGGEGGGGEGGGDGEGEAGTEALPLQVQEHPLTVVSVINVLDSVEPVDDSSLASSSLSVVSLPCDTQACGTVAKRTLAEEKRGEEPRTAPLQHSGKGECPVGVDGMGLKDQEGWILPALL